MIFVTDIEDRRFLLIHETCHAFNGCGGIHGKLWQGRMMKAAQKAEALGLMELRDKLMKDVEMYRSGPVFEMKHVYGTIEDWVFEAPNASFSKIVSAVCKSYCLSEKEFHRYFRRAKKVYLEAQISWKRQEKARKNFEQMKRRIGGQE